MAKKHFKSADDFVAYWGAKLEVMNESFWDLLSKRATFRRLGDIWRANPALHRPSLIFSFINDTYATHLLVTLRRIVDNSGNVVSLRKLIDAVAVHRSLLTRDWYVDKYDGWHKPTANDFFSTFAGEGDRVSFELVNADARALQDAAKRVVDYANDYVAHQSANPGDANLLTRDVNDAIDNVWSMYRRYHSFIRRADIAAEPPIDLTDWGVLRIPWIR